MKADLPPNHAEFVCQVFGVPQIPNSIPFAAGPGLVFPDRFDFVKETEILRAAAACTARIRRHCNWMVGDLLNFVKGSEASVSYTALHRKFRVFYSYQTLANYMSAAKAFPVETRDARLGIRHYDLVRAFPKRAQKQLLALAVNERLSEDRFEPIVRAAKIQGERGGDLSWRIVEGDLKKISTKIAKWLQKAHTPLAIDAAIFEFERLVLKRLREAQKTDGDSGPKGGKQDRGKRLRYLHEVRFTRQMRTA